MSRALVAAVLVAAVLYGAREHEVLDRAGLLGSCVEVQAAATTADTHWLACSPGKLTGYPDLRGDSCTYAVLRDELEYWRCPAPVVTSHAAAPRSP